MNKSTFTFPASICLVLLASCALAGTADDIQKASGIKGGLVVILGCGPSITSTSSGQTGSGQLTLDELMESDGETFLIQALDTDPAKVETARKHIKAKKRYGQVSADVWNGKTLPYADNLVNLIVVSDVRCQVSGDEAFRSLAPRGVLLCPKGSKTQVSGFRFQVSGRSTRSPCRRRLTSGPTSSIPPTITRCRVIRL